MRSLYCLTLALLAVTALLLAPPAHAQGADLQGYWTDPSETYLITVGEGVAVNPPPGGGGGAWLEYHANVTYRDGSRLMTEEGQPVTFTLTGQLHGNAVAGYKVEYQYVISVDGVAVARGVGQLALSSNQAVLDGYWKDGNEGSGRLTFYRLVDEEGNFIR
jgi:hypothetical protein